MSGCVGWSATYRFGRHLADTALPTLVSIPNVFHCLLNMVAATDTPPNPIYERYFSNAHLLASTVYDNPRSILFRKHLAMWQLLDGTKPSSMPTAELVERTGSRAVHHVLWLKDEGASLRGSISYREGKRGAPRTLRAEAFVRQHLNRLHRALGRLNSLAK